MKACHPDLSGDDPETTNFCMFINEVYEVGFRLNLNALNSDQLCCFVWIFCVLSLEIKHCSAGAQ